MHLHSSWEAGQLNRGDWEKNAGVCFDWGVCVCTVGGCERCVGWGFLHPSFGKWLCTTRPVNLHITAASPLVWGGIEWGGIVWVLGEDKSTHSQTQTQTPQTAGIGNKKNGDEFFGCVCGGGGGGDCHLKMCGGICVGAGGGQVNSLLYTNANTPNGME